MGAAALATGGVAFWQTHHFIVERVALRLPLWPRSFAGFRIAQISDLHFGDFLHESYFRSVVEAINREDVDLVFLTGDYVTYDMRLGKTSERGRVLLKECAAILGNLRARRGCYALLGNHDIAINLAVTMTALADNNIPVLRNRSVAIESGGERFWLAGLDDVGEGLPDLRHTLAGIPPDEPVVLGVHEPDAADATSRRRNIVLQLSGHSHGGQVRIPGLGAPVLPYGARKYPKGLYRVGSLQLYTNPGIGVVNLPLRLFCPPEITVMTLDRA